jgi:hypothetical protein
MTALATILVLSCVWFAVPEVVGWLHGDEDDD